MYHQFEHNLPSSYQGFKREIHQIFPHIFDTKHVCFSLRKKIKKQNLKLERLLVCSNLNELEKVLSERPDQPHVPRLIHPDGFTRYQGQELPHQAGYDALLAGTCFLNLAYLAASLEHPQQRPLSFRETLAAVEEHENMVNIARAAVSYVHLAGRDPELTRPAWLHLSSKTGSVLNCTSMAEILAR